MRARFAAAVLVGLSAGCSSGVAPDPNPSNTPRASVLTVSPSTVSGVVGHQVTLSASVLDQSGHVMSGQTVSWSSANANVASVSNAGVVTLAGVGSTTISVEADSLTTTVPVTVTAVPVASVATVTVTPSSDSLAVGASTTLSAIAKDSSGATIAGAPISWVSSNTSAATVSTSGVVKAMAVGAIVITATSGGKHGSANITVANATAGPECARAQAAWIWCDDFDTDRTASYYEYSDAGGNFVRQAGVGINGSTAMHAHYTQGTVDIGYLHLAVGKTPSSYLRPVGAGTATYRELYWRLYVRYAPGWTGGGGNKLTRAVSMAKADLSEAAFAHVWSGQDGTAGANQLYIDPASGTDSAGNLLTVGYNDFAHMRWLGARGSTLTLFDSAHIGPWYCVEVHAKLNDPGSANGVMQLYINGTLQAQDTGMNWVGDFTAYGFNVVMLENYWNAGAPRNEDRYIDNFVVSTQPIGCGPTGG